ncbi:MAG: DeoR/GlpR transcriptional regulator [Tepidanaerobacter acetatoxydans]|uniref:DeoR/GlpR family DNA-binding transcription regulator n=1 Tax=Tepidanaerobacter TaxID=499228 RepID=UPI000ADD2B5C|nr:MULTISPECIES: DeoR/GlpR family DNA-binding transcription regulator [Tepidanaerobacter]NLU10945.1 DeoR/GlpR transcriptional regulator [Tepidanaerobacter acetatoxydans]
MVFAFERQEQILNYVNQEKKASVKNLSKRFKVSEVTIRRDLEELANKGLIIKIHGGALTINHNFSNEIPYKAKFSLNVEAKKKIGKAAAKIIEDNDVVIFDAGSTTVEVAAHLCDVKNVTAITNDINVAMVLANNPNISLIVTGGILQKSVYTLTGPTAEDFLSTVHVNKTFLGADAISIDYGITNRTMLEIPIKKAMIKAAEEVIVVADYSKINKKVFAHVCDLKEIDKIVIDKIDMDMEKAFEEIGIQLIIADKNL